MSIFGIGTDIIEIERVAKAAQNPRFVQKYFTDAENLLFSARKGDAKTIAVNFAVKEAVVKAFGTGFRGISLLDIEVLRDNLGAPYVNLYGRAHDFAGKHGVSALHVSASHSKSTVLAFVVCEKKEGEFL